MPLWLFGSTSSLPWTSMVQSWSLSGKYSEPTSWAVKHGHVWQKWGLIKTSAGWLFTFFSINEELSLWSGIEAVQVGMCMSKANILSFQLLFVVFGQTPENIHVQWGFSFSWLLLAGLSSWNMEMFILGISLPFPTAFCSHLPSCNHSLSSCATPQCPQGAWAQTGNMVTSNGEKELKSLLLSLLFVCVWAFAALSSLENGAKKGNFK